MSKKIIVMAAGFALVAAGWFLLAGRKAPDPAAQQPQESVKYIASGKLSQLPEKEQKEYFEKLADTLESAPPAPPFMEEVKDLPEQERKTFFKNARPLMEARMLKEAKGFLALPEEQRADYLDSLIDKFEEHRAAGPPPPEDKGGPPRGPPTAAHMKERIETTEPATRAVIEEFFKAMRTIMQERGIKPPGPPPK